MKALTALQTEDSPGPRELCTERGHKVARPPSAALFALPSFLSDNTHDVGSHSTQHLPRGSLPQVGRGLRWHVARSPMRANVGCPAASPGCWEEMVFPKADLGVP